MRVSVDIPEPKQSLDHALSRQFAEIQKQLMGLVKSQQDQAKSSRTDLLHAMRSQQETLVSAIESLIGAIGKTAKPQTSDAMLEAMRGLKHALSSLPDDLKEALNKQYQAFQEKTVKVSVRPQVNVEMPKGLTNRLDSLEQALVQGLHRSRNRTFGSNY